MINKFLTVLIALVCVICIVPGVMGLNADFIATPSSGYADYAPFDVSFTDTSTGVVVGAVYTWYFGDGETSNDQNPVHTYTMWGTHIPYLVVDNGGGDIDNSHNNYYVIVYNSMSGSGTEVDPYIIATTTDWANFGTTYPYASRYVYYALGNDIDFHSNPSLSLTLNWARGNLDGRGYAIKNFYSNIAIPYANEGNNPNSAGGGLIAYMVPQSIVENLLILNSTIIYDNISVLNPYVNQFSGLHIGLLTGGHGGGKTHNIYIDENSWLNITGDIRTCSDCGTNIGTLRASGTGGSDEVVNVVSRANLYIKTPLRLTEYSGSGDEVGGLVGQIQSLEMENVLMAGHMYYTEGTGEAYTIYPNVVGDYQPLHYGHGYYYDSTTLSGVSISDNSVGVPTSGMTTQSNFPNMTFGSGGMAMSNIASIFDGYPIPYYFQSIPPTPSPTPTPTPTWTGTPVPTGTPTATPTPTPTNGVSPASIRWTTPTGTTITSAYYLDTVRYSFDTVVNGRYPPYYQTDAFFVRLWGKNAKTGQWVFIGIPGWYGNINGSTTLQYIPDNQAMPFDGNIAPYITKYAWSGWSPVTLTTIYSQYRVDLVAYEYSGGGYPEYLYASATLNAANDPWQFTNIGNWAYNWGGDGFRYLLAVIIIIILGCIPFFITRNFNMVIEMVMVMFGIAISLAIGLMDLWVVGVILVGIMTVFVLQRSG